MENKKKYKKIYVLNPYKLNKIMENSKISSGAKLVLIKLTHYLGKKFYCFPSQKTIAKSLGLSERQVRYHLKSLKEHKVITWKKGAINPKTKRSVNSNSYNLSNVLQSKMVPIKKGEKNE